MNVRTRIRRAVAATVATLACATAPAAPVTLTYGGAVDNYLFADFSTSLPIGTAMAMSLTFNETFSDGSYSFADDPGPASGWLTVGTRTYLFDRADPWSMASDGLTGELRSVSLKFLGTGPQVDGWDLFGLFVTFTPSLTVATSPLLGFAEIGDGFELYHYAGFSGSGTIVRANAVPTPASLSLVAAALFAAGWTRRRT